MAPFDLARDVPPDPEDEEPVWDHSGWSAVFLDDPKEPGVRLVGHTRLRLPIDTFVLTKPDPSGDGFVFRSEMIRRRHLEEGRLVWAWLLRDPADVGLIPKFRPL